MLAVHSKTIQPRAESILKSPVPWQRDGATPTMISDTSIPIPHQNFLLDRRCPSRSNSNTPIDHWACSIHRDAAATDSDRNQTPPLETDHSAMLGQEAQVEVHCQEMDDPQPPVARQEGPRDQVRCARRIGQQVPAWSVSASDGRSEKDEA